MSTAPTSILAIQFNKEQFRGEILSALVELVRAGTVRVIDAVVVRKDANGKVETLEINQLAATDLHVFDPLDAEVTGLLSNDDINDIATQVENGSAAGLLVLEHIWATKLAQAITAANGTVVMNQLLMPDVVESNLKAIAQVV